MRLMRVLRAHGTPSPRPRHFMTFSCHNPFSDSVRGASLVGNVFSTLAADCARLESIRCCVVANDSRTAQAMCQPCLTYSTIDSAGDDFFHRVKTNSKFQPRSASYIPACMTRLTYRKFSCSCYRQGSKIHSHHPYSQISPLA